MLYSINTLLTTKKDEKIVKEYQINNIQLRVSSRYKSVKNKQ